MLGKIFTAISVAFQNIKSNPLHTFLSTLGIVIGVAALVAILSLADGLEQFAREQITKTTSLQSIVITSKTTARMDNIQVQLEDFPLITPGKYEELKNNLTNVKSTRLQSFGSGIFSRTDSSIKAGARYNIGTKNARNWKEEIAFGIGFNKATNGILINSLLAKKLSKEEKPQELIDKKIKLNDRTFIVQGILNEESADEPYAVLPFSLFNSNQLRSLPPQLLVTAQQVEDVPKVKENVKKWLNQNFDKGANGFQIVTSQQRLKQAQTGMLVFKIIMGMITGISVLVGGIGVMNVLLISVTERTKEIGIRKAAGAKKRDIIFQFLSESIVVSGLGSVIGLITGMLLSLSAIPIVNYFMDALEFNVAFTVETFLIIGILAVIIGIIFGTYPVLKAARLTPVNAIRHE